MPADDRRPSPNRSDASFGGDSVCWSASTSARVAYFRLLPAARVLRRTGTAIRDHCRRHLRARTTAAVPAEHRVYAAITVVRYSIRRRASPRTAQPAALAWRAGHRGGGRPASCRAWHATIVTCAAAHPAALGFSRSGLDMRWSTSMPGARRAAAAAAGPVTSSAVPPDVSCNGLCCCSARPMVGGLRHPHGVEYSFACWRP